MIILANKASGKILHSLNKTPTPEDQKNSLKNLNPHPNKNLIPSEITSTNPPQYPKTIYTIKNLSPSEKVSPSMKKTTTSENFQFSRKSSTPYPPEETSAPSE